jgi:hypothetical protein
VSTVDDAPDYIDSGSAQPRYIRVTYVISNEDIHTSS